PCSTSSPSVAYGDRSVADGDRSVANQSIRSLSLFSYLLSIVDREEEGLLTVRGLDEFAVRRVDGRWVMLARDDDPRQPTWWCIGAGDETHKKRAHDWVAEGLNEITSGAGHESRKSSW